MSERQTWIKWVQSPECAAKYGEPSAKVISADAMDQMAEAAIAVIRRWESPDWKDGTHTAGYIAALRAALRAAGYEVDHA